MPITIAKFITFVELGYDKFKEFYNDYSLPNEKYFKLDAFLKIPDNVKPNDFLKKMGSFLTSVCNFKCSANPSFDNIQQIYGSGKILLKETNKTIPILIECEGYTQGQVSAARVSMRGGSGPLIESIYQLIVTFMNWSNDFAHFAKDLIKHT